MENGSAVRSCLARASLADADRAISTPVTAEHTLLRGDARWEPIFRGERTFVLRDRHVSLRTWLVTRTAMLTPEEILAGRARDRDTQQDACVSRRERDLLSRLDCLHQRLARTRHADELWVTRRPRTGGEHRVRFQFRPPLVEFGATLTALAVIVLITISAWSLRRTSRPTGAG